MDGFEGNLFRIVFDEMADPVCLKDAQGKFLLANKALATLYGTTPEAMIGKDDGDFGVPAELSDYFRRNVIEIMSSAQTQIVQEQSRDARTGRLRHYRSIKKPLKDAFGADQILVIAQDITDVVDSHWQIVESEQRLQHVLEATEEGIWDWHLPSEVVVHNRQWSVTLGYEEGEIEETFEAFAALVYPDDRSLVTRRIEAVLSGTRERYYSEHRMVRKSGEVFWVLDRGRVVERDDAGKAVRVMGSFSDISRRKAAEEKLRLAAKVFENAREGIMITDPHERIVDCNGAFSAITGYDKEEVMGKTPRILGSGHQNKAFYEAMWAQISSEGSWHGELRNRRKDGSEFYQLQTISGVYDAQGTVQNYVAFITDITQFREHERYLRHIAHHDVLTGLPNRVLLVDRLGQAMAQAVRRKRWLAVVFLDLDGFKGINDRYGHAVGDRLLTELAQRMRQMLRDDDTIARIGGDEFAVMLGDLECSAAGIPLLRRLLLVIAKPVTIDALELQVSGSLGVTFYPQNEEVDADQLLRQADHAMYQAKQSGKNRYALFDSEHDRSVRGTLESIQQIQEALHAEQMVLYYQPKVNMRTGSVLGAEALIRWMHPQKGMIPPLDFLPLIEDHPLSIELGEWVIRSALRQIGLWLHMGRTFKVSVNVGAKQLLQNDFVKRLLLLLAECPQVPPSLLEIEILETSALEDLDQAVRSIQGCARLGIDVLLDDFGTGYSSLSYLKKLPVTTLKIDQSFVRDMLFDLDDLAILEGVIGMAQAFRKEIVAEGVESVEHGQMLLRLGCSIGQGYGIGRPMGADDFLVWTGGWRPDATWMNLLSVSTYDFPLLFAEVSHKAWVEALEHYLWGASDEPPQMDQKACQFGLWLEQEGHKRYSAHPAYSTILKVHLQIHVTAQELIDQYRRDPSGISEDTHSRLKAFKEILILNLRHLMHYGGTL
ncbi:MAG: EAL domain-containing protein [Campylobacterales bacterium]|nr:EAL domain-containing protein [Campylobacterales bacterium]